MIKIEHPALLGVKTITRGSIIEVFHSLFYLLFNIAVLCLIVKRTVFKYNIFSIGNIHHLHLFGNFTVIISGKPNTVAFSYRNTPAANSAGGLIDICHDLTAAAVCIITAGIVKLSFYTVEQSANSIAVLTGYLALLWYLYTYPQIRWNLTKTVIFLLLLAVGMLLECYVNPVLMQLFIRTL